MAADSTEFFSADCIQNVTSKAVAWIAFLHSQRCERCTFVVTTYDREARKLRWDAVLDPIRAERIADAAVLLGTSTGRRIAGTTNLYESWEAVLTVYVTKRLYAGLTGELDQTSVRRAADDVVAAAVERANRHGVNGHPHFE